jgi:chromodomain-helicase-DNA-binding protein 1
MARAHRIGQKKVVNIYRLVSKNTIDEEIIERAKRKMVIEYCIIKQMDTSGESVLLKKKRNTATATGMSREELEVVLKFGAQNLFKQHDEKAANGITKLEEMNLDDILARAEHNEEGVDPDDLGADGGAAFLEQWKVEDVGVSKLGWGDIIPEADQFKALQEAEAEREKLLLAGGRKRVAAGSVTTYSNEGSVAGKVTEKVVKKPKKRTVKRKVDSDAPLSEKGLRNLHLSITRFGDTETRYERILEDAELDGKSSDVVLGASEDLFDAAYAAVCKAMKDSGEEVGDDSTDPSMRRMAERYSCDLPPKAKMIFADSGPLKQFNCTRLLVHCCEIRALTSRYIIIIDG